MANAGAGARTGRRRQRWQLTGACLPTQVGGGGGRGRGCMGPHRWEPLLVPAVTGNFKWGEAVMATLPFTCHSTIALCFYSGPGFLHECSQFLSSPLPSPQGVSMQPTAVVSLGLLSKPHVPAPTPPSTQADTYLRLGHTGLWHRPSV